MEVAPYYESEALRRAASANSTPHKLRALRRIVDAEIGADTSTELYRFADDWTVRLLECPVVASTRADNSAALAAGERFGYGLLVDDFHFFGDEQPCRIVGRRGGRV